MSASLVRKGLELFLEEEGTASAARLEGAGVQSKAKTAKKTKVKRPYAPANKRKVKSRIEEYRSRRKTDNTDNVVQMLKLLSGGTTDRQLVDKVSEFTRGRDSREDASASSAKKQAEPKSCFSEEDFARFEREYFVGPRRPV